MLQRETCIRRLMYLLSQVPSVGFVARNPVSAPDAADFPAIMLFEFPDRVMSMSRRGGYPSYIRQMQVNIEFYVAGTTEDSASSDLTTFLQDAKTLIYTDGATLGLKGVAVEEVSSTRLWRPPVGKNAAGIGLQFNIQFVENTGAYF